MKADFSRGFNPDRKRDKEYRRVLLQQGRVLLDSDAAAMVDASDTILRHQSQDLGTEAGGHDRGYMLTAGTLHATFRDLIHVFDPTSGAPLVRRIDYTVRFRKRFPSLLLDTVEPLSPPGPPPPPPSSVRIELFNEHPRTQNLVLWLRRDQVSGGAPPPVVTAAGFLTEAGGGSFTYVSGALADPPEFTRFEFTPPAGSGGIKEIAITFPNLLERLWVGMIESDQTDPAESFWIAPGRFHVKGLLVENPDDTPYESQVRPAPTAGLDILSGNIAVAYLEGWERMITALQDNGIRERALSTGLDTTVRTQAIGQVKTLFVPDETTGDEIRRAFANTFVPTGTLVVSTAAASAVTSPCDVQPEGGFTGRENHLYHFEVHSIDGDDVTFKFSREAGSELFPVESFLLPSSPGDLEFNVFVVPELGLRDGDIVEVLNDTIELGDDVDFPGTIDTAGPVPQFVPPRRLVGSLAVLKAVTSNMPGFDKFALRDTADATQNITPTPGLYPLDEDLRLRRWHGTFPIETPGPEVVEIGDGLQVTVTGTFEIGDWWQIEARLLPPAPGTGERPERHGPERLFAPLAIVASDGGRPEITEWLDEPFVSASQISADTIHFDNTAALGLDPPLPADDTVTLQAAFDLMLTKGIGAVIVDRITRRFDEDRILGVWQMTVGDGTPGTSFGDFSGANAIQQAVELVRDLAGAGQPWALRLFVKSGTYVVSDTDPVVLLAGERLILEGEGGDPVVTAGTKPATFILCTGATTASFDAVGVGSRIELNNVTLFGTASGAGLARTAGEIRVRSCRLHNRGILLRGSTSTTQPLTAAVVQDTDFSNATTGQPQLKVEFLPAGGERCPLAIVERCRIEVPIDTTFATVGSANTAVRWDGLTIRDSAITLGGSNIPITLATTTVNSGLLSILVAGLPTDVLSIGDIVFEDCRVDAGSPTVTGIFLHLPSGNSASTAVRVKSIDSVVIRGGRWTVRSDFTRNAVIYVGNNLFDLEGDDTHIASLVVERLEIGWSSTSSTLRFGTTLNAGHAMIFSADRVRVRDLSVFGTVAVSENGEVAIFGTEHATVDGIRIDGMGGGGGGGFSPDDRILLSSSGSGLTASNVSVVAAGSAANLGIVLLGAGGPGNPLGRRTVLTACRVQGNNIAAGFYKEDALDAEFVDCAGIDCFSGLRAIQNVFGSTPSTLTIRGGRFSDNSSVGVWISYASNLASVLVDGVTCTGTQQGAGLLIDVAEVDLGGGPVPAFTDWGQRGPIVVNNRVFGNLPGEQILIGETIANNIGGVCLGNYCRGTSNGILRVRVTTTGTYFMRGLTASTVAPWASKSKTEGDFQADFTQLAFNTATWQS